MAKNRTVTPEITEINLSIKIEGLWRENNVFEWKLNPDVNILSGANGSGKSTVLRILYAVLTDDSTALRGVKTTFYHENQEEPERFSIAVYYEFRKIILQFNDHKQVVDGRGVIPTSQFSKIPIKATSLHVDFSASLDQNTVSREDIQSVSNQNKHIRSQLDFDLYHHQARYTKYLLWISKRVEKAYQSKEKVEEKLGEIYAKKTLFFEIIDRLFAETNKKIDRGNDEIQFIKGEDAVLTAYHLSTGEKQILLMLLKALLQNNFHSIYLLDEPEISLHPDWQESLIDNIRILNPNAMLIIATHSPDIFVNGWMDKVVDMRDLLKQITPLTNNEQANLSNKIKT